MSGHSLLVEIGKRQKWSITALVSAIIKNAEPPNRGALAGQYQKTRTRREEIAQLVALLSSPASELAFGLDSVGQTLQTEIVIDDAFECSTTVRVNLPLKSVFARTASLLSLLIPTLSLSTRGLTVKCRYGVQTDSRSCFRIARLARIPCSNRRGAKGARRANPRPRPSPLISPSRRRCVFLP
jgi:hypothetical protein